jgi:hypothetical protein
MCFGQIHNQKTNQQKEIAMEEDTSVKSTNDTDDTDDTAPFEFSIDFSNHPAKGTKYAIKSLIEELQEHYRNDLISIAKEVVEQLEKNDVLTDDKEKDLEMIRELLDDQDFYEAEWFRISDCDGLIKFVSGRSGRTSSEADMIIDDVMEEIKNIFENEKFYD